MLSISPQAQLLDHHTKDRGDKWLDQIHNQDAVIIFFNCSVVDLQCCVHFCCAAKWFSYIYTHTHSRHTHTFLCCCSVAKSGPTLCDPLHCSMPGFPVLQSLPELLKPMSIELAMLSNRLILCCPLLLLPSIFPSTRIFSNELALCIKWPKYWSFSFTFLDMYTFFIHTQTFSDGLSPQKSPWKTMSLIQGYCYCSKCLCIPHWGMSSRTNVSLLRANDAIF